MDTFLRSWNLLGLDPLAIVTILLPLSLLGAAWAFRMACAICSVRVPDFIPAVAVVVVNISVNFGLRIALHSGDFRLGLGSQLLLVLLTSALIISISVRTTITTALAVTVTQVFLCAVTYYGLNAVGQAML